MKRIKYLITLIFISFVITTIYSTIYAEEETKSNINSNSLYSETNTFNYLLNDDVATQTHNFNNDARYDMSKRNDNIVSNDEPMITVLTH